MNFSTDHFFIFFSVFLIVFLVLKNFVSHRLLLLLGSWAFYASWNPVFLLLLISSTAVDFFVGQKMALLSESRLRWKYLMLSLVFNLGALTLFKYSRFAISTLDDIFGLGWPQLNLILPMGISFYTFQTLSYTLDIYRGQIKAHKSFVDFALFVAFFPQLVAGPIVRASHFLPQIKKRVVLTWENMSWGLQRFVWGLCKKLLIADHLSKIVDPIYADPLMHSGQQLTAATLFFAVQLYVDFSAYSDMAIGLARFFGFKIPENFLNPYFAQNIRQFWQRWHISLSTWLRDYLYIPLGGNRLGAWSTFINLMVVMGLGGLWHGAAWGFVIWGIYHGLLLVGFRLFQVVSLPSILGRLVTFGFVSLGWVFFRVSSWDHAQIIFERIALFLVGQDVQAAWVSLWEGAALSTLVFLGCLFFHLGWQKRWDQVPVLIRSATLALTLWIAIVFSPPEQIAFYYFIF